MKNETEAKNCMVLLICTDGETYYYANGSSLTVENIDPFAEAWKPSVMFSDGSIVSFA